MCAALPTHFGGSSYPGSMPGAREGGKVLNLFHVKEMFNKKETVPKARLEEALNVLTDYPSQGPAGEEVSPVLVMGERQQGILCWIRRKRENFTRFTVTVDKVMPTSVLPFVRVIWHRLLGVMKHRQLS